MFDSTILDVAIGVVPCFTSVALFVSAISEAISSALKLRHRTPLQGIKQMLNDPAGSGLVAKLYNHPLINPLSTASPIASATVPPAPCPTCCPPIPRRTPSPVHSSTSSRALPVTSRHCRPR
jgi:hypothetical protein